MATRIRTKQPAPFNDIKRAEHTTTVEGESLLPYYLRASMGACQRYDVRTDKRTERVESEAFAYALDAPCFLPAGAMVRHVSTLTHDVHHMGQYVLRGV